VELVAPVELAALVELVTVALRLLGQLVVLAELAAM
jgi:hypothetical protein